MLHQLGTANVLALDSGNALFRNAGVATDADKARAAFVFEVMDELGTRVMAVGQRDLSAGTAFLTALAKGKKLKLLSANLKRGEQRLFDAGAVLEAGGLKIGVIGLTAPGPVVPGEADVTATPTLAAAKDALAKLGARDVTVVLAATSYADAAQLSTELGKEVDFVIQSGEFRGTQPPQRMSDEAALLLASGQKGQALAKLQLSVAGRGRFADLNVVDREQQQLGFLREQVKSLEDRIKVAKDKAGVAQLKSTADDLKRRIKELEATAAKKTGPRTAKVDWVILGTDVADEPALKARVLKIEPTYAGAH
ncbi:MAG: 5'-nucleotidase [Myxococcota bacterium]